MTIIKSKLILIAGAFVSLLGCSTVNTPTSQMGPTAQLGVFNQSFAHQNYLTIFDDPIRCKGAHLLGGIGNRLTGKPIAIPANRLVTLYDSHGDSGYNTAVAAEFTVSFYPKANNVYFVKTNMSEIGNNKARVGFQIIKQVKDKNGAINYVSVPFLKREYKRDQVILNSSKNECIDFTLQEKLRRVNHR